MDTANDILGMPLFPHIYAIPMSVIVGIFIGYALRGKVEGAEEKRPPRPKV